MSTFTLSKRLFTQLMGDVFVMIYMLEFAGPIVLIKTALMR